jgi:hypothetical protein
MKLDRGDDSVHNNHVEDDLDGERFETDASPPVRMSCACPVYGPRLVW